MEPIIVTGAGCSVGGEFDVLPWLKSRKMKKFMGKQDCLAVIAAAMAAKEASLDDSVLKSRTGVYLSVGYIPFERADIEPLTRGSIEDGRFSMQRFAVDGFAQANPLLTFRCLPNMPIFHVSLNLGIQGPYFITYPGPGQFYLALERAVWALRRGEIDAALVGGVADQDNFLVQHHFKRQPATASWRCLDAAGFLCLQRASSARGFHELSSFDVSYAPHDAGSGAPEYSETPLADGSGYLGPASLPVLLARARGKDVAHELRSLDGFRAASSWRALPVPAEGVAA